MKSNQSLPEDGANRDAFLAAVQFWNEYDTCGDTGGRTLSELEGLRTAVADAIYNGDHAKAISLTFLAMLHQGGYDNL